MLGSAWSRNVPDGFDRARAEEQLRQAYSWAAEAFRGSGVVWRSSLYRAKTRRRHRDLQVHPPAGPGMIMPWPHDCST